MFSAEQLQQLDALFNQRLAAQVEEQRAKTTAQVQAQVEAQAGAQVQELRQLAESQHAAGSNLEEQVRQLQEQGARLQAQLENERRQAFAAMEALRGENAELERQRAELGRQLIAARAAATAASTISASASIT